MPQIWTHTAIIWSAVLLVSEDTELNLAAESSNEPVISFSEPKRIDNTTWTTWDNALPLPAWEYKVTLHNLEADDPAQARLLAIRQIETLAARLSFFISAPVQIVSLGGVTNAPKEPLMGVEYTSINMASQSAMQFTYRPIDAEQIRHLPNLLMKDSIGREEHDRINRSMRWLQHSRLAGSPTDEFTCLIIAFENLSKLLSPPASQFWRCSACKNYIESCPHCGASTEHLGSGSQALGNFVNDILKWPQGKWKKVWKLRNKVLHGSGDLTLEDQLLIVDYLADLEAAVMNAIRHVLHVSHKSPPLATRPRMPIQFPFMVLKWKPPAPEDPNANQPNE